jgi:hypothetical protein
MNDPVAHSVEEDGLEYIEICGTREVKYVRSIVYFQVYLC